MKRILIYLALVSLGVGAWSCDKDKLDGESIFVDPVGRNSDFDKYLYREFTTPYNIEFKYWLDDKETDQIHQLVPAKIESSKIIAVLLKHLFIDVYSEASPDKINFIREYNVRLIQLVGSGQYEDNGGVVLGEAYGGKKMSLYRVNEFDPDGISEQIPALLADKAVFQVIHHEYGHILHQLKDYPETFEPISIEDYVGNSWNANENTEQNAFDLGFISRYGRMNANEDFVEIFSLYITSSAATWNARVAKASAEGQAIIAQKVEEVKGYLKTSWSMDLDNLRAIILRRAEEAKTLEYVNLK